MTRDSHAGAPPPIGGEAAVASQAREADMGRPGPPAALHGRLLHVARMATFGEMATGIAHELNQPLTAVMGYAEYLKRTVSGDLAQERAIDVILSETERMANIVRKVGRITRYETKPYVGGAKIVDIEASSSLGDE